MEHYSELYKEQYNMEYAEASTIKLGGIMDMFLLTHFVQHEQSKGLAEEVLKPRIDAILDVMNDKPNKFNSQ